MVPPPAEFNQVEVSKSNYCHLGELHGCLYLLTNEEGSSKSSKLWVMNNYGVQESWSKTLGQ